MTEDLEIRAMQLLSDALGKLDDAARARVLEWAHSRYAVRAPEKTSAHPSASNAIPSEFGGAEMDVADLYDAASPTTDAEKALVIAYWFQISRGDDEVDSQTVNGTLKHLGHGVTNITRAFDALMTRTPRLMIQIRKEGTSKQARKRYKVTNEGAKRVREMMNRHVEK